MKKLFLMFLMIAVLHIPFYLSAQSKTLTLNFDFTAMKYGDIAVDILLFNEKKLTVDGGTRKSLQTGYADVYYFRYIYYDKTDPARKEIPIPMLPLYLPPDRDSYTITVPMPPQNPSGLAKIRFQNNFTESIIVHARRENTYGPVGFFDGTRAADEKNSVILEHGAAGFIIPAARYEITVENTQGDVLREYEAFYFPAAFDEYIFELDPDDREKVDASIRASGGATGVQGRIALDQKSEIVFTKPMIKALVEANISFYQTGKKTERIPVQLRWIRNDTVLTVQPDGYLSPDTEYCISLDLDSRDRRGNSLAEAKEWIFTTRNVFKPLPPVSRVSTRSSMDEILCEWLGVSNADGYEVRVYSGDEIIQIDIGKSTSHRFIRSALEADIKYVIIPYKKIEGKKAYSADALEMEASVAYFENNARSQPQNMRTYSIERDDSVGAKLVKLLRERDFIKTASNPAYIVILTVPQDRNERKRGHAIDIDSIIDIEILLSSDRSSVYHYNSKIDRVTGSPKDPAGAERNVAEKIINNLENNFLKDFDEKFLY